MLLDDILARTKELLQLRMSVTPRNEMERRARSAPPPRDWLAAVHREPGRSLRLIVEFRRVHPIRGVIRPDLDAPRFVAACETGGAHAVSICTEEDHFRGSLRDLGAARSATSLPMLRLDYILDRYQIFESRALGADAVSLSAVLLERGRLRDLLTCLKDLGMTGAVEVSDERELGTALTAGATCLRIDNRDPRTMRPIPGKADRLFALMPKGLTVIAEAEHGTAAEWQRWSDRGVDAALLGEPLLASANLVTKLQELLGKK